MAIPDYETLMLPVLNLAADGREHHIRDTIEQLAEQFNLTEDERSELLPSGRQATFDNRVGWARTYLKKAGLLTSPRRGFLVITERGKRVLAQNPTKIDNAFLKQFSEFVEFQQASPKNTNGEQEVKSRQLQTPEEAIETAYQEFRKDLAAELLQLVKSCPPDFFERLVVDLLVRMGYGGTRQDAGRAIGKTGDGGIDGIINEDRLGLDVVYIQAKRWDGPVSRPEIQKFAGALQGQRARKGVFLTTSDYTSQAIDYVSRIDNKIILIDGESLAELMIDYGVGVNTVSSYELKGIDSDYFEPELR